MANDKALRQHLANLLASEGAHLNLEQAIDGLPPTLRGSKPPAASHSPWELLEHIRIAQWDILEFSRNPTHVSPDWPAGYWPKSAAPPNAAAWDNSVKEIARDLEAMKNLVLNPQTDLFAKIPHGSGQTILREALLIADHNAYHVGQMVLLRRFLGAWDKS